MAVGVAAFAVALGILGHHSSKTQETRCRCRPSDECWPVTATWDELNDSLNGNLAQLRPIGAVCHEADYSESDCNNLIENYRNTTWRVENPAALQIDTWELWRAQKQSCQVNNPPEIGQCDQGRVSRYSAYVQSVTETADRPLQSRFSFILLASRASSTWESFTPQAPAGQSVPSEGPAVTVGVGVLTGDLYSAAADGGFTAVGGSCSTVGVVGGWIQSGGYGILTPSRGLGVDNLLEVGMVTAEGEYVNANQYQNPSRNGEHFWTRPNCSWSRFGHQQISRKAV